MTVISSEHEPSWAVGKTCVGFGWDLGGYGKMHKGTPRVFTCNLYYLECMYTLIPRKSHSIEWRRDDLYFVVAAVIVCLHGSHMQCLCVVYILVSLG